MDIEEFKNFISDNSFYIYGSGFAAEMFYKALEIHGLLGHIRGVVVTRPGRTSSFHSIPVREYAGTEEGIDICLAVHSSVVEELRLREQDRAVWIYPHIYELLYGKPVERRTISLREILEKQDVQDGWIESRYAGLKAIETGDLRLKELYLRCVQIHASAHTAERRFMQFGKLYESIKADGFDDEKPLVLDEDMRIIDGLHRIAIAVCLGQEGLSCLIYPSSEVYDSVLTQKNRLSQSFLTQNGYEREAEALNELKKEIRERYEAWNDQRDHTGLQR